MNYPECTNPHCPRPSPDRAHLCKHCTDQLRGELQRLPQLADDLVDTITRIARLGARTEGRSSAETPLPWNEPAAIAGRKVDATVDSIAQAIATRRAIPVTPDQGPTCEPCSHQSCRQVRTHRHAGPTCAQPHGPCTHRSCQRIRLLQQRGTRTAQLARWISQHVDWIRRQADAAQFADAIGGSVDLLEASIEKAKQRAFAVGPCSETTPLDDGTEVLCEGTLYAVIRDLDVLLPSKLICNVCAFEVPSPKWPSWGRKTGLLKRIRRRGGVVIS